MYVFDDSEEQAPPPYLAKTPVPLSALATGREVKGQGSFSLLTEMSELKLTPRRPPPPPTGDYVLRDPAGGPRGMVRVLIRWKYPFQPSADAVSGKDDGATSSQEREERRGVRGTSDKPVAKPRVKVFVHAVPVCGRLTRNAGLALTSLSAFTSSASASQTEKPPEDPPGAARHQEEARRPPGPADKEVSSVRDAGKPSAEL